MLLLSGRHVKLVASGFVVYRSPSETELLLSLQKAVVEEKGWIEFLGRLASLTNASFSAIIVENARSLETARIMTATPKGSPTSISSEMLAEIFPKKLQLDRIYAAPELMDQFADQRLEQKFQDPHVSDLRTVRINVSDRLAMTIGIFGSTEFSAADGAILRRLLPYLQSCTRAADIIWRERARASLSTNLMQKNIMGWFLIDRAGYIIDATFQYHRDFPGVRVLSGPQGDRLALAERKTELALTTMLAQCATDTSPQASFLCLSQSPMLHLRVTPFSQSGFSGRGQPIAVATLHGESSMMPESVPLRIELFGLLPNEVRLATQLAAGKSLTKAAEQLDLTIETARNYSKKIFAKTATRGQTDLVHLIFTHGLAELGHPQVE